MVSPLVVDSVTTLDPLSCLIPPGRTLFYVKKCQLRDAIVMKAQRQRSPVVPFCREVGRRLSSTSPCCKAGISIEFFSGRGRTAGRGAMKENRYGDLSGR